MNTALYACQIAHHRFKPKPHRFVYGLFMLALDLDDLPALDDRQLLSINRPNLFSFWERDYLPVGSGTLKERVVAYARDHGIDVTRVLLVTLPRILGYAFNPVSFYFCYGADGRPAAAIAEVTNTFHEVKPYFLGAAQWRAGPNPVFHLRERKSFYVSPFSDVDVQFDFTLPPPAERLALRVDDYDGEGRTLASALTGHRRELTDLRLLAYFFRYPLLTVRVTGLIHWHALRLWLKKIPWYPKAARSAEQHPLVPPSGAVRS
ncbi:MAG TPA: DUF1365 domain-containing protein [Opitutaceae bacterium]|jgi:hypothetical protein